MELNFKVQQLPLTASVIIPSSYNTSNKQNLTNKRQNTAAKIQIFSFEGEEETYEKFISAQGKKETHKDCCKYSRNQGIVIGEMNRNSHKENVNPLSFSNNVKTNTARTINRPINSPKTIFCYNTQRNNIRRCQSPAIEKQRNNNMTVLTNRKGSFIISPRKAAPNDIAKLTMYFKRKKAIDKKYTDMLLNLKLEEATTTQWAITKEIKRKNIGSQDFLCNLIERIKIDYEITANLLKRQKTMEEEELIKEFQIKIN